jgi:preprotein translocase subunit YajC
VQNGGQLLLLLVLISFTVWVFSRGRRQQREMQATQSRLQAGAEVMMTSGVYGRVVALTDDGLVRLETSPGVVSRWERRAVARVISTPDEPALEDEPAEPLAAVPPAEPLAAGPAAEPADPQRVDAVETEPVRHVEPVLPVEPSRPEPGPPAPAEPDRPPAAEPDRPPAADPPGPVPFPKDAAPPDRG